MSGERIETAGDLDALPTGTILRNEQGVAFEVADEEHGRLLYGTNGTVLRDLPPFVHSWPLTVVYRPDRDLIAEAEARGARSALLDFAAHFEKHGGAWGRMSVVEYIRGEYLNAVAGGSDD